jgi:two-component system chemotaxis response regulator CheB
MKKSTRKKTKRFSLVVIGGSAGSHLVISKILDNLPSDFSLPMVIVRHVSPEFHDGSFVDYLDERCELKVKEADQNEKIKGGHVYMAPPNYHLLLERDLSFSLNIDERVKYCRPSIDVLFESAADALGRSIVGVILSGANDDGADGLRSIKANGGYAIVQDPQTAEFRSMPEESVKACVPDEVLSPAEITETLIKLDCR